MIKIPKNVLNLFQDKLEQEQIPERQRPFYEMWLRFYLDFCDRNDCPEKAPNSVDLFVINLESRGKGQFQQRQAARAVKIFQALSEQVPPSLWDQTIEHLERKIATLQYSGKTLSTYRHWVRAFRDYLEEKDPGSVTAADAAKFFTHLAVDRKVVAATQNQAFNSLLFLFAKVWDRPFKGFDGVVRAKRSNYIPTVLSRKEVDLVLDKASHPMGLIMRMMYGCGLRLSESVNIRINNLCFETGLLTIRNGKGNKDRTVPLPRSITDELRKQIRRVEALHVKDLESGYDGAFMPTAMSRKFRSASKQLGWQWLFPARQLTHVPTSGETRRYHAHESKVSAAIRQAALEAGMHKRVTAHTFRHTYATHLLQANYDIRTIQRLLGHSDVKTTMIYTHIVDSGTVKEPKSPLDF
ncbi:integron integrase [Pelagicoccus mobilis]|uniref:Integron integrase n=1 Tax=Pelagicoccus mobilis TaxID=415221 RepID=A0A934S156_9BACT|nr:integron integrase [Pelagicoccus mobilis]MBK1877203.1 integron integrase [Pelagicoccus mobilis]